MFRAAIFIMGLCLVSPASQAEDSVNLTTHNLNPYGYFDENARFTGSAVTVVRCAMAEVNRPLEIKVMDWNDAQMLVREGAADGFFAASRNEERDSYATLSEYVAPQNWTWYVKADSPLDPARPHFRETALVSSFHGANMQTWLENNQYNTIDETPEDTRRLFLMLINGRLDAILANDQVVQGLIERYETGNTVVSHLAVARPLGVYFSNRFLEANPDFLDTFNSSVRECRP